jgi:ATP-dependent Clp protease ATP-binding subunit ClpB
VDFRNTVVIMTSNLGNALWLNGNDSVQREDIQQVLQAHFRPEFLNRVDEILVFHPLLPKDLEKIVVIQLARLKKMLQEKGYGLDVTPAALAHLAAIGYDPNYGARPLKRAIQREIQDALALKILAGDFHIGETIRVDADEYGLTFESILEGEVLDETES